MNIKDRRVVDLMSNFNGFNVEFKPQAFFGDEECLKWHFENWKPWKGLSGKNAVDGLKYEVLFGRNFGKLVEGMKDVVFDIYFQPRFYWQDVYGKRRLAVLDFLIVSPNLPPIIVELKNTFNLTAIEQSYYYYKPIVEKYFNKSSICCVVYKNIERGLKWDEMEKGSVCFTDKLSFNLQKTTCHLVKFEGR